MIGQLGEQYVSGDTHWVSRIYGIYIYPMGISWHILLHQLSNHVFNGTCITYITFIYFVSTIYKTFTFAFTVITFIYCPIMCVDETWKNDRIFLGEEIYYFQLVLLKNCIINYLVVLHNYCVIYLFIHMTRLQSSYR